MKVALVGLGRMGQRHLQVVQTEGLEVVGICDLNPEALSIATAEYGIKTDLHFTDVRHLLRETAPECVIIATTAPTHCEYTCLAARQEQTMFCARNRWRCRLPNVIRCWKYAPVAAQNWQ